MKILAIHADHISFEAKKQAIKSAEEDIENAKKLIEECLVVFTTVEKADENNALAVTGNYVVQIKDIAEKVNTKSIVLYPYAHLSQDLGGAETSIAILKGAEEMLKKEGFSVVRSPFGWYKSFEISCKGHPLSELSRSIGAEGVQQSELVDSIKGKAKKFALDKTFEFAEEKLTKDQQVALSAVFPIAKIIKEAYPKAEFGVCGFHQERAYLDIANVKIKGELLKEFDNRFKKITKKEEAIVKAEVLGRFQEDIAKDLGKDSQAYSAYGISLVLPFKEGPIDNVANIAAGRCVEVADAYWKNNANNEQLTRLYFVAFDDKKKFDEYFAKLEEAQKRDHRILGEQLDLFSVHNEAAGMPFFHDKGLWLYRRLEEFMIEQMTKRNYEFLKTPMILNKSLWLQSGHWEHYKENMYFTTVDGKEAAVKPMNCPGHILVYKNSPHSYRELPIKAGEFGIVHRHELSGVLSGLFRVRFFTQDDAHVFCSEEQLQEQIEELIGLVEEVYSAFGFKYHLELSTKPAKAMGDDKVWKIAEKALAAALDARKLEYKINPGDGAFYGPKIDCHVQDALGRSWQCGTIQLDFQMPEKFDLTYEGSDGKKHRPIMLHRAIYGSFERFLGILIEHYAGKFPLWLSPVPVRLVTVTDRSNVFAEEVQKKLKAAGIVRAELDTRSESIGKKVREAQLDKVNYIITIGDKEVENKKLAVRTRAGEVKFDIDIDTFIDELIEEIANRKI